MGLYARRDASRPRQYFELLIERRTYMSIRIVRLRPFLASSRRSIVDKLLDRLLECGFNSTLLPSSALQRYPPARHAVGIWRGGAPYSMLEHDNGSSPSGINVFLIADNRLLRETLERLLQKRAGIGVVGVSRGAGSAWEEGAASRCEIVLTACLTSDRDGSLISELFEHLPQIKVVLFGMDEDSDVFLKFAFLGLSGFLLKDASAAEMISAVRGVAQGEAACPPKLCMTLLQYLSR